MKTNSMKRGSPRIYIDTLATFSDFREGKYSLHSVKKMTGTENFMELSDNVKNCSVELFEQCRVEKYMKTIEEKCNCVPWTLWDSKKAKVRTICSIILIYVCLTWVQYADELYRFSHFVCLMTMPV